MANGGSLRNRKPQVKKETAGMMMMNHNSEPQQREAVEDDVDDNDHDDDDDDEMTTQQDHDDNDDDAMLYDLTPMIQRSILTRLDVGPFILAYVGLILLDGSSFVQEETQDEEWNMLGSGYVESSITTLLFLITLLFHVVLVLLTQWNITVKVDVGYRTTAQQQHSSSSTIAAMKQWTHCLVQSRNSDINHKTAGIVPINHTDDNLCTVSFQDRTYRCCMYTPDADVSLWNTTTTTSTTELKQHQNRTESSVVVPRFRSVQYPIHLPLSWYSTSWKGHATLSSVVTANHVYGRNTTSLQLPSFIELVSQQMIAPFFIFQVFCVILWSLDEYWYYALFTLFALIMFESIVAYNRLKSLQRLHDISHRHSHQRVYVRRGGGVDATSTKMTWMTVSVAELVPGDWISLSGSHIHVPADILLLHGTAVCDEALLTGESVPQLKQPLDATTTTTTNNTTNNDVDAIRLNIQDGEHKESLLFGGTVLLVGTPPPPTTTDEGARHENPQHQQQLPPPPDNGIMGIVLRTGFETAQGNLLRTMAHSSTSADGVHTMDTFIFILLLVLFAIVAAVYVLNAGWYDDRRNHFRLTLHVVIIITSVVPPELPMELSLAVTNSVADLMKRCQVYCTEHFRIPWAGEVDVCCFDKTGTLTSDEMWLKGVRLFNGGAATTITDEDGALVHPTDTELPWESARIMAACHSLALAAISGKNRRITVIGDPLEQSVMKSSGYQLIGSNVVGPDNTSTSSIVDMTTQHHKQPIINILHRFAFSSKLKRMTVLVSEGDGKVWALTKGAPETIKEFLSSESIPTNYDDVSFHHMSRGRRVLAMAYREVGVTRNLQTLKDGGRELMERNLTFAGFLVLDCPLKPDSKSVISELQKSGHSVVMITGDAILTAAEVARQVGIIRRRSTVYRVQRRQDDVLDAKSNDDPLSFFECVPLSAVVPTKDVFALSSDKVTTLKDDLREGRVAICISGDVLVSLALTAAQCDKSSSSSISSSRLDEKSVLLSPSAQSTLSKLAPIISVFARHAPHQKEAVIAAFNHGGYQTLMCGDGTNDVGALKRAHVGISIISAPEVESKQREAAAGYARSKMEEKQGGKSKSKKTKNRSKTLEESMRKLREAQEELDQVELGDASVAAPFTSRAVSIKCCKDVVQQGRCTLVTMIQIYKILGINCLVNALVLSKLFIHGGKQGDRQLTILGIGVAALFYFVTRAEPLPTLSPIRPPASVLCVQTFLSITGQCLIHIATILFATDVAMAFVDPYDPSLVPDGPFNPNVLNTCTFLLTCLSTINTFAVNYRGRPFMKDLHENKLFYRSLQICYAVLAIATLEIFPPLNDLLQLTTSTVATPLYHEIPHSGENNSLVISWVRTVDFPIFMAAVMTFDTVLSIALERFVLRVFEQPSKL